MLGPYTSKLVRTLADDLKLRLDAGRASTAADVLRDTTVFELDGGLQAWWMREGARNSRDLVLDLTELLALSLRLMDWHSGGGSAVYALASHLASHAYSGDPITADLAAMVKAAGVELNRGCMDERALYCETISTLQDLALLPRCGVKYRRPR